MYIEYMKRGSLVILVLVLVGVGLGLSAAGVAAQTPTPPPTPTPSVVSTDSGVFVLEPRITYGEAGVMIGLVLVAALLLLTLALEVVSWFKQ